MKNKRLIIILSIFAFLVLTAVLCSTVFTVKTVKVNWLTTKVGIEESDEVIISEIKTGGSVFLVDKEALINDLEIKHPYLKVDSVEIKFPNKLVLHTAVRKELYSLKIKDNKYAILDGECKVLCIVSDTKLSTMQNKPVPINLEGYSIIEENIEVSKIANLGWIRNVLNNFSLALYQNGYDEISTKNNIKSINVNVLGYENSINIEMNYGVSIQIQEISQKLTEKFGMAINIYDNLTAQEKSKGIIRVYTSNGVVGGEYDNME